MAAQQTLRPLSLLPALTKAGELLKPTICILSLLFDLVFCVCMCVYVQGLWGGTYMYMHMEAGGAILQEPHALVFTLETGSFTGLELAK